MANGDDVGSGVPNVVDTKMQESVVDGASQVLAGMGGNTGATALPRVLGDSPIAVLLVDRTHSRVTYANTAALELAGDVALPIGTEEWTRKAGVTDVDGNALTQTSAPLSRLAAGQPVAGEPVRIRGTAAVAETDRGSDDSRGPVVWATGFPLGAGARDEELALLVFLPVEQPTGVDDPEAVLQSLRERAVLATDICFTISDPRQPGNPLVWVNPSFSKVTGYSLEDAIGRNCKFLQGPATDPAAVQKIVDDLSEGRSTAVTLLNYRPDGTAFWNHVSISPVYDGAGELVSFVGIQSDVTSRIVADAERDAAHAAERSARRHAEESRARMALMAEATTELVGSLDTAELQHRLARLCVPRLADWVSIWQVDEDGLITSATSLHREGEVVRPQLTAMETEYLGRPFPRSAPVREAFLTGQPVLREDLDGSASGPDGGGSTGDGAPTRLGAGSLLALPLPSRRGTWGAITLVREAARGFSVEDLDVAQDLCRRAGQALDNARIYSREASVAETLQHALLPELPTIPRITAAARYTAASAAAAVGGDFYDLLPLPGGATGIVIGDVAGHDITAATAMGQLRGLIRSACWDTDEPSPDIVLARVDRLLRVLGLPVIATAALLRAFPPAEGEDWWSVECANAGHPPVYMRTPDGAVEVFCDDHDLLLGTGMADLLPARSSTTRRIQVGTQLLLYTDGLIEQPGVDGPGRDIDEGLAALRQRWESLPWSADPQTVCDAVHDLVVLASDDLAVLALQLD